MLEENVSRKVIHHFLYLFLLRCLLICFENKVVTVKYTWVILEEDLAKIVVTTLQNTKKRANTLTTAQTLKVLCSNYLSVTQITQRVFVLSFLKQTKKKKTQRMTFRKYCYRTKRFWGRSRHRRSLFFQAFERKRRLTNFKLIVGVLLTSSLIRKSWRIAGKSNRMSSSLSSRSVKDPPLASFVVVLGFFFLLSSFCFLCKVMLIRCSIREQSVAIKVLKLTGSETKTLEDFKKEFSIMRFSSFYTLDVMPRIDR